MERAKDGRETTPEQTSRLEGRPSKKIAANPLLDDLLEVRHCEAHYRGLDSIVKRFLGHPPSGRCRSRTRTLARHPVFGTGVCTTQTSPSRTSTRDGNRTRCCALKRRRPDHWTTRARVPPAGLEPAHRASDTRVTSTCGGSDQRCRVPSAGFEPATSASGLRRRFRHDLEGVARQGIEPCRQV